MLVVDEFYFPQGLHGMVEDGSYNHDGSDLSCGESPYVPPIVIAINCGHKESVPVPADRRLK
jgi:hypothetical protein